MPRHRIMCFQVAKHPSAAVEKDEKRQRRIKRVLDQHVDQQLSKALIQDGLAELDDLEKEKLCLHEITSLL